MQLSFGKFQGQEVKQVPGEYLRWLLTLPTLENPVRQAVKHELDRRTVNRATPATVTPRTTALADAARLTQKGWVASTAGYWSRWWNATTTRPGWCCFQVTPAMALAVQGYLDSVKAKNRRAA
jgi:hypothetical protein